MTKACQLLVYFGFSRKLAEPNPGKILKDLN